MKKVESSKRIVFLLFDYKPLVDVNRMCPKETLCWKSMMFDTLFYHYLPWSFYILYQIWALIIVIHQSMFYDY